MGIFDRVFGRSEPEEKRFIGGQWLAQEASSASAGVLVTQENATSIGAVYAAVKLYADTVAGCNYGTANNDNIYGVQILPLAGGSSSTAVLVDFLLNHFARFVLGIEFPVY